MKNVIVFFNGKPGKVVTVQQATTSVRQEYPAVKKYTFRLCLPVSRL